jgi:hypothetical protein
MLNPDAKIAKSKGVDLPILKVYLAGRISGDHIEKCLGWRKEITNYFRDYKGKGAYPIAFLDPLNSGEADSVDGMGLTSSIPPNLIYDKDILSVETADVIIANMEDFFECNIGHILQLDEDDFKKPGWNMGEAIASIKYLQDAILNRRENIGTVMEVAIALYLRKPVILIVPERRKEIFEKHPFTKRASTIVTSIQELFDSGVLQLLYKSIAGAIS